MRFPVLVAAVSVALGAWGCAERDKSDVDTVTVPFDTGMVGSAGGSARRDTSPPPAPAPVTPDGDALGSFIAANTHSANFGRLAAKNGSSQAVRDLGTAVARDQEDLVARAKELGNRLSITAAASPTGAPERHTGALGELQGKSGVEFDRAYLQHAIEHHREIQDEVSRRLPTVVNEELKTFLQQAIPVYQAHQKAAQDLLAKQPSA